MLFDINGLYNLEDKIEWIEKKIKCNMFWRSVMG